ncbi:MAG: phosphatase PAP2 family protein [Chloroflexota bacterium]
MTSLARRINLIIRENPYFFLPCLAYFALVAIALIIFPKGTLILWFGKHNSIAADYVFYFATYIGDGAFAVAIALLLALFRKVRIGLMCFGIYALSGLTAQGLKRLIDLPRPKGWFAAGSGLHFVEGVKIYSAHSFPSGHSVTAFALFLFLSVITKDKRWGAVFFLVAYIVGLSRVYLAQHFYSDVLAGSVLGFVFSLVACAAFNPNADSAKMNKPLIKLRS